MPYETNLMNILHDNHALNFRCQLNRTQYETLPSWISHRVEDSMGGQSIIGAFLRDVCSEQHIHSLISVSLISLEILWMKSMATYSLLALFKTNTFIWVHFILRGALFHTDLITESKLHFVFYFEDNIQTLIYASEGFLTVKWQQSNFFY